MAIDRLIRVVDLETTGFAPPEHAPVELGWCDLVAGEDLLGAADWARAEIDPDGWRSRLLRPGVPIPPETRAVHHILPCDLIDAEPWRSGIVRWLGGISRPAAFAAHNARFERQWCGDELVGPAPWICTYKCALRAWPEAPGHANQVLRYWRNPEGLMRERALPAHRAGPDAYVTAFLLRELLRRHPLDELLRWSDEPAILSRVTFGKRPEEGGSRGLKWSEIDDGLLHWVLDRDMGEDINHTARLEYARRREVWGLAPDAADDGPWDEFDDRDPVPAAEAPLVNTEIAR